MILSIIATVLSILATVLPTILIAMTERKKEREHDTDVLVKRDLDVLHGPPTGGVQPPKVV